MNQLSQRPPLRLFIVGAYSTYLILLLDLVSGLTTTFFNFSIHTLILQTYLAYISEGSEAENASAASTIIVKKISLFDMESSIITPTNKAVKVFCRSKFFKLPIPPMARKKNSASTTKMGINVSGDIHTHSADINDAHA
ncbi:hypothetical protein FACS1894122_04150 [Alphaproteobacteria bacterium]|nr:hypothetical protein FACS1894122_04150 [Alphaproteobacteria bacterium]